MPHRRTSITTWPLAGSGAGRSTSSSFAFSQVTAFMTTACSHGLPGAQKSAIRSGRASAVRLPAALRAGLLLLRAVAAAARAARLLALAAAAALAALRGGVRRVGDLRRALLAHALLLESLVLLVVLDARPVIL